MFKRKWNNRCFVLGSLSVPTWKQSLHNMEERVESKRFFCRVNGIDDAINAHYEAVSARTVLEGYESDFIQRFKLRRAIRRCSMVYVVNNTFSDMEASDLYQYACRKRKRIVNEEDVL